MADLIMYFCIICLVIILLILLESHREFKSFIDTSYTIYDKSLPDSFEGYKIAVIADVHNSTYGKDNCKIFDSLSANKPDCVVIAGDMVLCKPRAYDANLRTAKFVKELNSQYELYYGIGNHERGLHDRIYDMGDNWDKYIDLLPSDINMLSNSKMTIIKNQDEINIYGVDIDRYYYKRLKKIPMDKEYLDKKLGISADGFNILIAHNPDYFKAYSTWGANLTISGHVHGGMMRLPFLGGVISPKLSIFPKYDYGLFEMNEHKMIISSGLGAHFPKIRVNNKPEIVYITLRK